MPFELKVTPSLFQKDMTKIYKSILHHTLIYIDDILLFLEAIQEQITLLYQFSQITKQYGIMLFTIQKHNGSDPDRIIGDESQQWALWAKPIFGPRTIEVFFMKILHKKQIQIFRGIINYIINFIPNMATYTRKVSKLLKKGNSQPWGLAQTNAVKHLKQIA